MHRWDKFAVLKWYGMPFVKRSGTYDILEFLKRLITP